MVFADRVDAGRQLMMSLRQFEAERPLVLGLPRGGVVVGAEVARALRCDLDVMLVKKLRALQQPELALGAVSEGGEVFLNEHVVRLTETPENYLRDEIRQRTDEITQQQARYRAVKPRIPPTGRVAIIVDDGLATGATMIAAVQATAHAKPAKLIVAVPVSSADSARSVREMNDVTQLVSLITPEGFEGVGQFYYNFAQVEDDEVVRLLSEFAR
jgi:predicted phosphoribosyltransferase